MTRDRARRILAVRSHITLLRSAISRSTDALPEAEADTVLKLMSDADVCTIRSGIPAGDRFARNITILTITSGPVLSPQSSALFFAWIRAAENWLHQDKIATLRAAEGQ